MRQHTFIPRRMLNGEPTAMCRLCGEFAGDPDHGFDRAERCDRLARQLVRTALKLREVAPTGPNQFEARRLRQWHVAGLLGCTAQRRRAIAGRRDY